MAEYDEYGNEIEGSSFGFWDALKWVGGAVLAILTLGLISKSMDKKGEGEPKDPRETGIFERWKASEGKGIIAQIGAAAEFVPDQFSLGMEGAGEALNNAGDATRKAAEKAGLIATESQKTSANETNKARSAEGLVNAGIAVAELGAGAGAALGAGYVATYPIHHFKDTKEKVKTGIKVVNDVLEKPARVVEAAVDDHLLKNMIEADKFVGPKKPPSIFSKSWDWIKGVASATSELPIVRHGIEFAKWVGNSKPLGVSNKVIAGKAFLGLEAASSLGHAVDLGKSGQTGSAVAEGISGVGEAALMSTGNPVAIALGTIGKDVTSLVNHAVTGRNTVSRSIIFSTLGEMGGDELASKALEPILPKAQTVEDFRAERQAEANKKLAELPSDKKAVVSAWMEKAKAEDVKNIDTLGFIDVAERHNWKAPVTPAQSKSAEVTAPKG